MSRGRRQMLTLCQNLTLAAAAAASGLQRGGHVTVLNIRLSRSLAKHHAREFNPKEEIFW